MRLIAVYHKGQALKHISHLDVQRTLQRAFRRAELPLAYSNGFNPHPQLSFATALATGQTSDSEWFDVELIQDLSPEAFCQRVNEVLPPDFWVSHAFCAPEGFGTLAARTRGAAYNVRCTLDRTIAPEELEGAIAGLLSGEIIMNKRTKGGIKPVDIRPQILAVSVTGIEGNQFSLRILGKLQSDGGLRAEMLLGALFDRLDAHGESEIHRSAMYFDSDGLLPRLPLE